MQNENKGQIYILGAGGFAREIYSYLKSSNFKYKGYELAGFLSDNHDDLDGFDFEHEIKGPIRTDILTSSDVLIMGVSGSSIKKELFNYYSSQGIELISYIHPTAFVGIGVEIADGSVLAPYAILTTNISIGKCTTVNVHSSIGHDVTLGDFCTLSGHCDITGGVTMGDSVFLGSHVLIIPKIVIESDSVLGAGCVVIKRVKSGTTVFGNPAKKIK